MELLDVIVTVFGFLSNPRAKLFKEFLVWWCSGKISHELYWGDPACKEDLQVDYARYTVRLPKEVYSQEFMEDLMDEVRLRLSLLGISPETCISLEHKFLQSSFFVSPLHVQ